MSRGRLTGPRTRAEDITITITSHNNHITITIAKGRNGPQQGPPREHMPVQSTSELVFVITELARAEAMVAAGAVRQAAA